MSDKFEFNPHGTTILAVRRQDGVAMGGDGQVTLGNTVMKGNARKVRRLFGDKVLAGFAGGTADAFTLFERFEGKLEKYGNLTRAAIELAKDWRSDRYLRRLEALLLVADPDKIFVISGNGDVIEPDYDVAAIGSGGPYALSAARALLEGSELDGCAREIAVLLELALEALKQGEGVRGAASKAREHLVVKEASHLAGVALHDGITERDLSVTAHRDCTIAANRNNGRSVGIESVALGHSAPGSPEVAKPFSGRGGGFCRKYGRGAGNQGGCRSASWICRSAPGAPAHHADLHQIQEDARQTSA